VAKAPSLASQRLSSQRARAEVREQAIAAAGEVASELETEKEHVGDITDDVVVAEHLTRVFSLRGRRPWESNDFKAVDDVSFRLRRGTTTAVVGESGSGKSTLARMVLDLLPPTEGRVLFDGVDIRALKRKEQMNLRRQMQPVFQNPYASLDPLFTIYESIAEPLRTHDIGTKKEREARIRDLLDKVSLPASVMTRFPAELSGGQRQRVAIARALALEPEVVICDEAVSALDVLVQAQILELLNDLQAELGLSYLFITHDLAVVRQIADDVLVMQDGKVVEAAPVMRVFDDPQEAYTKKLLDAIPGVGIGLSA
jgi:peptide/nickel transport system ATP-binding protein